MKEIPTVQILSLICPLSYDEYRPVLNCETCNFNKGVYKDKVLCDFTEEDLEDN